MIILPERIEAGKPIVTRQVHKEAQSGTRRHKVAQRSTNVVYRFSIYSKGLISVKPQLWMVKKSLTR